MGESDVKRAVLAYNQAIKSVVHEIPGLGHRACRRQMTPFLR